MNKTSPFRNIAAATIPFNAVRIKEIEHEITLDSIKVTPLIGTELDEILTLGKTVTIRHEPFRKWLESNDRLVFESNSSDHTGRHVQLQHEISYTDYIISPPLSFVEDIVDYLTYTGRFTMPYIPN